MAFDTMLLRAVLIWAMAAATTSQTIRSDCQNKCGDVRIPYPFGTSEGCYLNDYFVITCNASHYSPPKPFFLRSNVEVLSISLDGQLRINTYVAVDCSNQAGSQVKSLFSFTNSPFPFSVNRNKFIGVGCDSFAFIEGNGELNYYTGCLSLCTSYSSVANGSCSGIGCCKSLIPKMMYTYAARVQSFHNHTGIWGFNPCSYSFLVEEESYDFSTADLIDLQNRSMVPTVVDWSVGKQTCKEAQKNMTSYACQANSDCRDSDNGPGYTCDCSAGYQGNPYIPDGCQDVDECADPRVNDCEESSKCINKLGNYTCACPKGYHGDGRKSGEGCVGDQLLVIEIVVGTGVGLILLLAAGGWLYLGLKKRKLIKLKRHYFMQNGGLMLQKQLLRPEGSIDTTKIFTEKELKMVTNNFDESRIIGRGGYGTVYKAVLPDQRVVAIKKSRIVDRRQNDQFINEVVVLLQINHKNVVKLLGCCLETDVPLLVYEFVTNGTLSDHIHENMNKTSSVAISWDVRLRIATETAGVLSYLHSAASTPIIHRDIKSTNILLDDNYTAKVSDFGLSRLVSLDQAQLSTVVQGTVGYLDPEYLQTSQLTDKSDVYSFGVVMVELLTGKKAVRFDGPEEERNLARYFLSALKEDQLLKIVEGCVREGGAEEVKEFASLAERCLRVKGEERPTMKIVAAELEGLTTVTLTKHLWVEGELGSKLVTQNFVGEASKTTGDGGSSTGDISSTIGCDNIMLQESDGR